MQLVHSRFESPSFNAVLQRTVPEPKKIRRVRAPKRTQKRSSWSKRIGVALGALATIAGLFFLAGFIARRAEVNRMIAQADAARGRSFYKQSCIVCHGSNYQGMPHQGVSLRESQFIASMSDEALWDFLKVGRKPDDKLNQTKLLMPPRGANPNLDDEDLMDIVAFLRSVNRPIPAPTPEAAAMQ